MIFSAVRPRANPFGLFQFQINLQSIDLDNESLYLVSGFLADLDLGSPESPPPLRLLPPASLSSPPCFFSYSSINSCAPCVWKHDETDASADKGCFHGKNKRATHVTLKVANRLPGVVIGVLPPLPLHKVLSLAWSQFSWSVRIDFDNKLTLPETLADNGLNLIFLSLRHGLHFLFSSETHN